MSYTSPVPSVPAPSKALEALQQNESDVAECCDIFDNATWTSLPLNETYLAALVAARPAASAWASPSVTVATAVFSVPVLLNLTLILTLTRTHAIRRHAEMRSTFFFMTHFAVCDLILSILLVIFPIFELWQTKILFRVLVGWWRINAWRSNVVFNLVIASGIAIDLSAQFLLAVDMLATLLWPIADERPWAYATFSRHRKLSILFVHVAAQTLALIPFVAHLAWPRPLKPGQLCRAYASPPDVPCPDATSVTNMFWRLAALAHRANYPAFTPYYLFVAIFVPRATIFGLYVWMLRIARHHARRCSRTQMQDPRTMSRHWEQHRVSGRVEASVSGDAASCKLTAVRVLGTSYLVETTFQAAYLLTIIYNVAGDLAHELNYMSWMDWLGLGQAWLGLVVNFFVFAVRLPVFREGLKELGLAAFQKIPFQ